MIEAKVICDSIANDIRLTTFQLRYPKFIHGEFMTHRVFSRNASSSRAIPTKKLIEEVRTERLMAHPVFWGKNQAGMQAAEEFTGADKVIAQGFWHEAAMNAADVAEKMLSLGVHKQIVNRILEPFSHINVVCTATEYMNFFGLRLDKAAQPEMRTLAEAMWKAWNESLPKQLRRNEWHLPYITGEDYNTELHHDLKAILGLDPDKEYLKYLIKISVARCARVSYLSFESGKKSTTEEDLKLHDRLLSAQPLHASPAEHQATPDHLTYFGAGGEHWNHKDEWGNFYAWRQYRKTLEGEHLAPLPKEYRKVA